MEVHGDIGLSRFWFSYIEKPRACLTSLETLVMPIPVQFIRFRGKTDPNRQHIGLHVKT